MSESQQGPGWWQASDGKWYPPEAKKPQGGPPPPGDGGTPPRDAPTYQGQPQTVIVQKRGGCLRAVGIATLALIALVVVIIIIAVVASNSGDDKKSSSPATPSSERFTVGQTAHTGDFDVTLNSVENPFTPTNQLERPPAGKHFVAVELTLRNTSNEQQTMSTVLGAEILDDQSRPWNVAVAATDRPQLEGTVAAGESRRGWVTFAVGDDATGLKLRMKGNLTATGSVFVLS